MKKPFVLFVLLLFNRSVTLYARIMTIYLVALLFATLTLGVSSPRVSLHRWLLFTIRALGKDGEEDLNKLSVINSNSCRNMVFFVIMIETFDFSFIIRLKDFHFLLFQNEIQFLSRLFGLFKRIFPPGKHCRSL